MCQWIFSSTGKKFVKELGGKLSSYVIDAAYGLRILQQCWIETLQACYKYTHCSLVCIPTWSCHQRFPWPWPSPGCSLAVAGWVKTVRTWPPGWRRSRTRSRPSEAWSPTHSCPGSCEVDHVSATTSCWRQRRWRHSRYDVTAGRFLQHQYR